MNTIKQRRGKPGIASFLLVLSAGAILSLLTLYTYRQSIASQEVTATIQLRTDYSEKEDAILRSIIAVVPNRAIQSMQHGANENSTKRQALSWQRIFTDSLDLANARSSISNDMKTSLGLSNLIVSNSGDSALAFPERIFNPVAADTSSYKSDYMSAGINRVIGNGYPAPLETADITVADRDALFPIITDLKMYGNLAQSEVGVSVTDYPNYNILKYPQINFGYAEPGDDFVAKRNWWAFSMELANNDNDLTGAALKRRDFVLSIYEIPSQLAISASAFMSLGEFGTGEGWDNVTISGGVFAGKAVVEGDAELTGLSSRRGMSISSDASIGGQSFVSNPFAPGVREAYQVTDGAFFPVSLASESGRVAFVPINRGKEFFDRFAVRQVENNTLSPTTWNNYSVGAVQCAMRLDIIEAESSTDSTPTKLRFSYLRGGVRQDLEIDLFSSGVPGLPPGYLFAANEGGSYDFGDAVIDLAYGEDSTYAFELQATGFVTFNNARFGDPLETIVKSGYYRPSYPFEITNLATGKICVAIYPERFENFLESLNADDTSVNNSLAVNVDYTTTTGSLNLDEPSIPTTDIDYGVVLKECSDLTSFTKGFSLVTNLRTYIGDDFNIVPMAPPAGYTPTGDFFPPSSLFTPEKRYGVEIDPYAVSVSGRIGSVASDDSAAPIRPLDSKGVSGSDFNSNRITVNLKPITHPAELPPITMMNWLITIDEVRAEFVDY